MCNLDNLFMAVWRDESGISSVEYALLLSFLGGAIVLGATVLGDSVGGKLTDAADCIDGVDGACDALAPPPAKCCD